MTKNDSDQKLSGYKVELTISGPLSKGTDGKRITCLQLLPEDIPAVDLVRVFKWLLEEMGHNIANKLEEEFK